MEREEEAVLVAAVCVVAEVGWVDVAVVVVEEEGAEVVAVAGAVEVVVVAVNANFTRFSAT